MNFDADKMIESCTWPTRIGGVPYKSRAMDPRQMFVFAWGLQQLTGEQNAAQRSELSIEYMTRLFPLRLSYWWLGNPVDRFRALSREEQDKLMADYLRLMQPHILSVRERMQPHIREAMAAIR